MQTSLLIHTTESNNESQAILDANKVHFSNQCSRLFAAMMDGIILTSEISLRDYQIVDFRRRICDLKGNDVQMTSRLKENNRSKEWFMTTEQREYNKRFIK